MAVTIRDDGSFEVEYVGPYGGLNVQMPENLIPDSQSPALNDVILRNAELRSRPALNPSFLVSPNTAATINAIGMGNVGVSTNPNIWAATSTGVYRFSFTTGTWTQDNATFAAIFPTNWRVFAGVVYGVNGSAHLASWTARGAFTLDNATVGANTVGAFFVDELDNHIIMANTNEGGGAFPQRIRWSASGLPAVWDPTVNVNAGSNDFLEVPDSITGLMMLGRVGYIFRLDGITEIAPTGRGLAPFDFNHLWAPQIGIGNLQFFAIAQYGTTGFFVSRDNVYMVQSFALQAIGGSARDAILKDLGAADQTAAIIGAVVPTIDYDFIPSIVFNAFPSVAPGTVVPYLAYYLIMKLGNGTKIWVYSIEDQSWTNFFLPGFTVTGRPTPINWQVGASGQAMPLVAFPVVQISNSQSAIAIFNAQNFNDTTQGSSYSYRMEEIIPFRMPTVRRVMLVYRDLGAATITVTLTGVDDNATIQTASTTATIGNSVATNTLMIKLVDIQLTAFRPQLTISRAANGGPMSIARVVMSGTVEKQVTL